MRWVTENGKTAHAVHEEATGWAQTEKHLTLVFWCGRTSNETWLKAGEPKHCKTCKKKVPKSSVFDRPPGNVYILPEGTVL